jgi:hypothetical protein
MNLPTYECAKIPREIELSGKADDPLWRKAPAVHLVRADTAEGPRFLTEARLLHSDTTLYVAFHCEDDYIWGTCSERDSAIYEEECVELFISPASTAHQYYEINVSPKNVVFDACILNGRGDSPKRSPFIGLPQYEPAGLQTRVHVEGVLDRPGAAKWWRAEYALPLDQLIGAPHTPPLAGDEWRMNLYRIDCPHGGAQEFYAWSPTGVIDFHLPSRFGTLRFVGSG